MKNFFRSFVFLLLISTFSNTTVFAQNLLANGDFESGWCGIGFILNNTGYSPASNTGVSVPGNFLLLQILK